MASLRAIGGGLFLLIQMKCDFYEVVRYKYTKYEIRRRSCKDQTILEKRENNGKTDPEGVTLN